MKKNSQEETNRSGTASNELTPGGGVQLVYKLFFQSFLTSIAPFYN